MDVTVRHVERSDEKQWSDMYSGYRDFYRLASDASSVATTWSWIIDRRWDLEGLVALDGERLVGLANLRWFARPSMGRIGLYLDDLYTASGARGNGVGGALLREAARLAADRDAQVVRWITAEDNATARSLYDQVATATSWVTYDMPPAS